MTGKGCPNKIETEKEPRPMSPQTSQELMEGAEIVLKALVEQDVKLAIGHGVKASRSKAGALTVRAAA